MKVFSLAFIAFLAFALMFSYGCAQKTEPSVNEPPASPQIQPGKNNSTPSGPVTPCLEGNILQKDECFAALAKKNSDPTTCGGIYSIEKLDECYGYFADSSMEYCRKINDAEKRAACLTKNAKLQKSDEACRLIENEALRANCLKEVIPPCMMILDEEQRALCIALEKNDYTKCTSDGCFAAYAQTRKDENACGLINSEPSRFACRAVVKEDISQCKLAALAAIQDSCVENASKTLDDKYGCDLATPGSEYSNRCYLYFAVKNSDMNVCRKAYQEEQRDSCYSDYAGLMGNISSCARVINSLNKISCYMHAAKANRMPSLCNPLGIDSQMRDCYSGSILYLDEGPLPSDCQYVASSDWKNKCYYRAALKTYNKTLCTMIDEGPDKKDCDDLFGK